MTFNLRSLCAWIVIFPLSLYILSLAYPWFRYSVYVSAILALLSWFVLGRGVVMGRGVAEPFLFLVLAALASSVLQVGADSAKDAIIIMAGICPIAFVDWSKVKAEHIFWLFFSIFMFSFLYSGGIENLKFSLLESKSTLEFSPVCYAFSFFFIYFYLDKRWSYAIFALLIVLLTMKRAAILGLLLVVFLIFLSRFFRLKFNRKIIPVSINIMGVFVLYLFSSQFFEDISQRFFGVSAAFLTMGRSVLYGGTLENCQGADCLFWGTGFSSLYEILVTNVGLLVDHYKERIYLHNDVARLYIEIGFFPTLLFIYLLYRLNLRDEKSYYMVLFYNFTMLFDNSIIYSFAVAVLGILSVKAKNNVLIKESS